MADEVKAAPAASPAAAPVVVSTPTQTVKDMNAQREATVGKEPVAPGGDPAVAETRAVSGRRSNLITNPAPVVDPDAPVPEKKVDESTLPASTLAEIEAGRAGLKHTHTAANKPLRPGNPVDATATPQKA